MCRVSTWAFKKNDSGSWKTSLKLAVLKKSQEGSCTISWGITVFRNLQRPPSPFIFIDCYIILRSHRIKKKKSYGLTVFHNFMVAHSPEACLGHKSSHNSLSAHCTAQFPGASLSYTKSWGLIVLNIVPDWLWCRNIVCIFPECRMCRVWRAGNGGQRSEAVLAVKEGENNTPPHNTTT